MSKSKTRIISVNALKPDAAVSEPRRSRLAYFRERWWAVAIVAFLALAASGAVLKYLDEDARGRNLHGSKGADRHMLDSINPFISAPTPAPTPQLSKEYIYAGSRLLAVEDANANAAPPADLAVWRPGESASWWVMGPGGSIAASAWWGTNGDIPAPGDYDGDGKVDFCVFRPTTGAWYIIYASTGGTAGFTFGMDGDKPAIGDYDGDGKSDPAIFRPSNGSWYWLNSGSGFALGAMQFGISTDIPAPADYDGDGRADHCVFRPGTQSAFYMIRSSNSGYLAVGMGADPGDKPVSGDYDGDGKADPAIRSGNTWTILNSSNNSVSGPITWELAGDKPVPNDYDGDGKCDIAVWRDSNGDWYIRKSASNGALRQEHWGQSGDYPVPAYYRR